KAEDGIRDWSVTGVQTCALPIFATYSDGTQNQISGSSVGWTTSDSTIATVTSPGGSVTGVGIGSATITASSQGINGTATVNVTVDRKSVVEGKGGESGGVAKYWR